MFQTGWWAWSCNTLLYKSLLFMAAALGRRILRTPAASGHNKLSKVRRIRHLASQRNRGTRRSISDNTGLDSSRLYRQQQQTRGPGRRSRPQTDAPGLERQFRSTGWRKGCLVVVPSVAPWVSSRSGWTSSPEVCSVPAASFKANESCGRRRGGGELDTTARSQAQTKTFAGLF